MVSEITKWKDDDINKIRDEILRAKIEKIKKLSIECKENKDRKMCVQSAYSTSDNNLGVVLYRDFGGLNDKAKQVIREKEEGRYFNIGDRKMRANSALVETVIELGGECGHNLEVWYIPEQYKDCFEIIKDGYGKETEVTVFPSG